MTMTATQAYEELTRLNDPQLDYLVEVLNLDRRFLRNRDEIASRAADILELIKQRAGWIDELERVLKVLFDSANSYLRDRLAPIRQFLVEPPPNPGSAQPPSVRTLPPCRGKNRRT